MHELYFIQKIQHRSTQNPQEGPPIMNRELTQPRIEPLESRIAPAAIVVTVLGDASVSGKTTLRQAIAIANAGTSPQTIVFKPGLHGYIDLSGDGTLSITHDVTISGPGASNLLINGAGNSSIFTITGGAKVSLSGLGLVDGTNSTGSGGAVNSNGPLTVSNCLISGNTAEYGGGIYDKSSGPFILINSVVSGNKATNSGGGIGGGVYAYTTSGGIEISGSKIINNSSDGTAGGMRAEITGSSLGNLVITNSTISGNFASSQGGGARLYDGSTTAKLVISSSVVSGNLSESIGGGIRLYTNGPASVTATNFVNNQSTDNGGGLWIGGPGSVAIKGGRFAGNTAATSSDRLGGGLYSGITNNTVTITGANFADNQAGSGAGIGVLGSPSLTIASTTIVENHATEVGGGIGLNIPGTTKITGCTISSNSAPGSGGGAYIEGSGNITVQSTKFLGNTTFASGGGLILDSSSTHISLVGNTFSGNTAFAYGGGLDVNNTGTFDLSGGSFTGNSSDSLGGGIFIGASASGTIHTPGILITQNLADGGGGGVAHAIGATGTVTLKTAAITGNVEGVPKTDTYGNFVP
jgi:parallel beta-helix repeat protein